MFELTKEIPGYEGYYATHDGHILSMRSGAAHRIAERWHRGYLHVNVRRTASKVYKEPVHKLVLLAYRGPKPTPLHQCRHLNGKPINNSPSNVKWGTGKENAEDSILHGTHPCLVVGEKRNCSKLSDDDVRAIMDAVANSNERQIDIAARYNINQKTVSAIKNKQTRRDVTAMQAANVAA